MIEVCTVRASLWAFVTGQSDITSPWVRVTGQTVRDLPCSQWPVSSDLERSSKDQAKQSIASRPQDFQWSTTRTEQGTNLLTISVLTEGSSFWTSQIAIPLDKSLFEELTLPQEIGIPRRPEQHLQCNTRAWLHCKAEPWKFYLQQLTEMGQTDGERTKLIGVRPSSALDVQTLSFL